MANDVKIVLTAQDKASKDIDRVTGRVEALEKASSLVASRMAAVGGAIAGVASIATGLALSKQFIDMADAMALLQSRVKLATSGAAEFAQVQADLFALAQRNSVSLEEVSGAFSRLSDPVKRLGGSSKETIGIIDALSKSLQISGASSQESAAAIAQFGQAMGSGKLQGDEFKSLAEAAPRFMKAISEGSGIAAENLKEMASEGKLTADVVGNALLKSLGKLNAEAAQMPDTVGQAMTRLKNEVAKAVDEINQAGGINTALAGMVGDTAALIAPIKQEMIEAFQAVGGWIDNNRDGLIDTGRAAAGVVGDLWRMAEAMSAVAGFAAEAGTKSSALKTTLEALRIIIAGIEDGVTIIGAAFVKVGAQVTDVLYKPLGNLMLAYGKALEMLGNNSAKWWQEAGDRIRNTTSAAHEYADGVHQSFADSQSALGLLNAELGKNSNQQAEAGSAAAAAGVALTGQAKAAAAAADAYKNLKHAAKGSDAKKPAGADPYQQLLDSLRKRIHATEHLNELEKLNIELQEKKYARLSPLQKANLQALAMQIDASRLAARYAKQDAEDEAKRVSAAQRSGQAMADETRAIWDKIEAEVEAAAAIGQSKSEIEARTLALMQEQLAWREALGLQDEQTEHLKDQIRLQQQMVAAARNTEATQFRADASKAAIDAAKKAAEAAAAEWQKTVDRIDQTFHDGFVGMLEKGKADWESFADSIANTFKSAVADEIYKMTIRPLVVQVVGAFSGQTGVAGQAQGIGGVISNVQSAYAGVSGGITNAANSFATSGMGQWAGLSTTYGAGYTMGPPTAAGAYGYTAGGTALTSSGSSFVASAAPYAAAIAALAYGDHLMKAGWGLDNNRKGYAASAAGAVAGGVAAGASAGASAGSSVGPVGTVVGAAVGAIAVPVLDRLFGHNNKTNADAAGIQGTFDLSGFSGEQWQQFSKKGGTFRSDKRWTDTYDVSSDIDKELDSAFSKTVAKLQEMGKTLGVETSKSIDGFTHEFSLQLSENGDMSKAGEKLAAEISRAADELVAKMVPNIDEFARLGESATQTFTRLGQEVTATDAILLAMGKNAAEAFGGVGLASIAARENLIDLAGGLDQLASKTQSFYANFYTDEEQLTLAAKQAQGVLDKGFADLGLSLPTDRKGFRDLVESYGKDLSTESARKYFNALLDLQDEYNIVAKAAESASDKLKSSAEKLAAASDVARQSQGSIFDAFASDAQKLEAAQKIVNDTFASLGKDVPESAAAFLSLAQSLDPAIAANQEMIAALAKAKDAFAYVRSAADNAAIAADNAAIAAAIAAAQSAADSTASQMETLAAAIGSVADPVQTLTDKVSVLRDKLGASYRKDFSAGVNGLNSLLGWRSSLSEARGNLTSAIDAAQLRLPGADVAGILRGRESALWDQLRSASIGDQPKIAQQIEALFTQRISWQADQDKAGKRNQLEESYKLATGTLTAQQDALQVQRTALTEQISAMQKLTDISHRLRDTVASMAVDGLSSLSPAAQVQAARQAFETALSQAKSGDSEAASKLGELGNAYRQAGRTFYASSTDYANIDSSVRGALASMADVIDKSSQTSAAQTQLAALDAQTKALDAQGKTLSDSYNTQTALLDATVNTAAEEIALLTRLNDTLSASDVSVNALIATQLASLDDLAKSMQRDGLGEALQQQLGSLPDEFAVRFVSYTQPDESRDLLRQQLDAAKQQLEDEKARYSGLVAMHNEQMEQLKALNARLRAIENNAALAGAGA